MDPQTLQLIIPIAVPLLIAGLKRMIPRVPRKALPILAPVLGGLLDAAMAYASGGTSSPVLAAALGSAGVGLREIVDQMRGTGATATGTATGTGKSGTLSLSVLAVVLCSACATPQASLPVGVASVMYANARADYAAAKVLVVQACAAKSLSAETCAAAKEIDTRAQVYRQAVEKSLMTPEAPVDWAQVLQYSEQVMGLLFRLGLGL